MLGIFYFLEYLHKIIKYFGDETNIKFIYGLFWGYFIFWNRVSCSPGRPQIPNPFGFCLLRDRIRCPSHIWTKSKIHLCFIYSYTIHIHRTKVSSNLFFFLETVSYYVALDGLKLRDPFVSTSQVLTLKACTTTSSSFNILNSSGHETKLPLLYFVGW